MSKKNILITGHSGLLGSALVEILKAEHFVYDIGFDNITDQDALKKRTHEFTKIDWIIHTAAITDVDYCEKNEENKEICRQVNVGGTEQIRDLLAKHFNAKLLYISTVS